MRKCNRCNQDKPLSEFYIRQSGRQKGNPFVYCKLCSSEKGKVWYKNNRERHNGKSAERYLKLKKEIVQLLGSKCKRCFISDIRVLCIDHKNGGGKEERKILGGNRMMYAILAKIKSGDKSYQILCLNCNWIKALENGELKRNYKH